MATSVDPENNESQALFALVDLNGRYVLEIGSGDGRLTWRYAPMAAHVTAIEPFADTFVKAEDNLPDALRGRVAFHNSSFEAFAAGSKPAVFDVAILSWSL